MKLLNQYPNIQKEMDIVQELLIKTVQSRQPLVKKTAVEAISSKGKRLRPLLVILSAMLGEYDSKTILPLAAAIELIHTATLVHDDIIDESKLGRGRESIQSQWGKDVAVFTGDFLLCKAFFMISQNGKGNQKDFSRFIQAIKIICEGEIQQYDFRYKTNITIRQYLKRIAAKTAILFSVSCYIGALQAKCSKKIIHALVRYGMSFGMAFQITDDVLDLTGEISLLGKPVHTDLLQGIYTLPIIYTLQHSRYSERLKKLLQKEEHGQQYLSEIYDLVNQSGGVEYSKQLAQKYLIRAEQAIRILPDCDSKKIMIQLLEMILDRTM